MTYDFTVVGAGIAGLSAAYKLTRTWPDASVLVLDKEDRVAAHQTGKNSGVIHSGIYYKPGSYKAHNCVDGRKQLVDYCEEKGVTYDVCGKVIVATREDELESLERIYSRGLQNGIEGIRLIDRREILELEPYCAGIRAIHVPCAGIVDFRGMCEQLARDIEAAGGNLRFGSKVTGIRERSDHLEISLTGGKVTSRYLISCAGLQSDLVARSGGIQPPVQIVPFRGEYFELTPEAEHMVKTLIYPVPGNSAFPFLGVHFTTMALGGVECGPNAVFAFKREGYSKLSFDLNDTIETFNFPGFWKMARKHWRMGVDEYYRSLSKEGFLKNLQRLIPQIRLEHLKVSPSGVRAMALLPNGEILDDFHFETVGRQLHVLNAPSPAATAGLAIGDEIVNRVRTEFHV